MCHEGKITMEVSLQIGGDRAPGCHCQEEQSGGHVVEACPKLPGVERERFHCRDLPDRTGPYQELLVYSSLSGTKRFCRLYPGTPLMRTPSREKKPTEACSGGVHKSSGGEEREFPLPPFTGPYWRVPRTTRLLLVIYPSTCRRL